MEMQNTAVYFHIPFCDHKCIYCDFYSLVTYENFDSYLTALLKEINFYSQIYSQNRIIDTIYFGGGTPSFMSSKYISTLIDAIYNNFNVSNNLEITLETNPGTVNKNKLSEFFQIGINRLSIGIQSFDDSELQFLTRIHNKNTALQTIYDAVDVGFYNINIDLIFSIPNQSLTIWKNNLEVAVSLPITHISAYSLILEKGTILNKLVLGGKVKLEDEQLDVENYKFCMDYLSQNGFIQYEVSNFAKNGFECKHNLYYWEYNDYLSFGTSAHSFIKGHRWWNYSSLKKYIYEITINGNAKRGEEKLSSSQMLDEYIMLSLRSKGIDIKRLSENFGNNWFDSKKNVINDYISNKYLIHENQRIKCTPKGYIVCDEIINQLL